MKLIIAEKPSLAANISNSIGNMRRRDGFYEGKDYLVTWAFGHLFSLCDVEKYTGSKDTMDSTQPMGQTRYKKVRLGTSGKMA